MKKVMQWILKQLSSDDVLEYVFKFLMKQCGDDKAKLKELKNIMQSGVNTIDAKLAQLGEK